MAAARSSCLDVFRNFHDELCKILDADPLALTSFAAKLYSKKLVDIKTKREVLRIKGYQGADTLLDHVMMKLESDTRRYGMVLEIIGEEEALNDVREKMVTLQMTSTAANRIRRIPTVTGSITDAESFAKHLRNSFEELVIIINTATTTTDVSNLRVRIDIFFSYECPGQYSDTTDNSILCKLDACLTPEGILRCLIRNNFIGYLNYKLLEVFVKASDSNPSLKASIEEYEQEYLKLFKCDFHSIIRLFHNPILAAVIPAFSLPDFSIRLGTKWEESSVYELKELFQDRFPWAEHLVILDVTKNCVLIKYGVLPFFISAVVKDLTDPTVREELKREDITIELSPELMKYSSQQDSLAELPALAEFSSSDVVQFLRKYDVAITDRQKTQLQQQRRLTSIKDHESVVVSDDKLSLEAAAGELEDLPLKKLISDWDEHGTEKNSSSGFHEDLQMLDLHIKEDASHAEKNFIYEKALKTLLEERKTMEAKNDMMKRMTIELEETRAKLSRTVSERQIPHQEHLSPDIPIEQDEKQLTESGTIILSTPPHTFSMRRNPQQYKAEPADSSPSILSMAKELKDLVDWEEFAIHLPEITQSDVEKMKRENQHLTLVDQKMKLFSHWLSIYPATWNNVFEALMDAKEFELAIKILDHKIPSSTEVILPLTVANMTSQLEDLVNWKLFATHLPGITQDHIQIISQENSALNDQKIALYECWLSQYTKASWSHVVTALRKIAEHVLAQNIESTIDQLKRSIEELKHLNSGKPVIEPSARVSFKASDSERLHDPPDLPTFMRRVAYKAPNDCHYVALNLLSQNGYRNFKAISKDQKLDISEKYELCFEMWEREVEKEGSWGLIIAAVDSSNHSLAEELKECYL